MIKFGFIVLLIGGASAVPAYSSSASGAGSFSGSGSGFGSNLYGGTSSYGSKYPYSTPGTSGFAGTGSYNFPVFQTPYEQQQWINNFLGSLQTNYANAATYTFTTPNAKASAFSSTGPSNLVSQQLAQQAALFEQVNRFGADGSYGAGSYGGFTGAGTGLGPGGYYAPNFAGATAAYGPGGYHQTATLIPSNPQSPNVDTRFDGDGGQTFVSHSQGHPGGFGLSTSSFSSSSDIDGQKTAHRQATTTINDNGKVTTYTVRS